MQRAGLLEGITERAQPLAIDYSGRPKHRVPERRFAASERLNRLSQPAFAPLAADAGSRPQLSLALSARRGTEPARDGSSRTLHSDVLHWTELDPKRAETKIGAPLESVYGGGDSHCNTADPK